MNFQQAITLFTVLSTIPSTLAHIGGYVPSQDIKPIPYCGRNLARVLALLCYDEEPMAKRSGSGTMLGALQLPSYYEDQDSDNGWPWLAPHKARSLGVPSRGKRQFVVNECCDKACTINELMSYC